MATRQELHLEILNQEYSRFVKDQVLTAGQLNEIIDFFEDQHRLTRTCLVGTGIVCGLHLFHDTATATVTLTPGVAVTTDGDLLKPPGQTYHYFTRYTPPDDSHYDPFYLRTNDTENMLTLYQLLTREEKEGLDSNNCKTIAELGIPNWVGLLYLEYYTKEPVRCTPTHCDTLGIRQKATVKLLILSPQEMDKLIYKDGDATGGDDLYLKYHDACQRYFNFPVIKAKRVRLGGANTVSSAALASAYRAIIRSGATGLVAAIENLYTRFAFLLDKDGSIRIDMLTGKLGLILTRSSDIFHAQYTYDFYKDVIAAYNELREILHTVPFACCPNLYSFPKHIMLGAANMDYGPKPPQYRHPFYPSPAVSKSTVTVDIASGMFARLQLLIEGFNPQVSGTIRITPSLADDQRLAERAIPCYYQNIQHLVARWNYHKSLKGQEKYNLSYNAELYRAPIPAETRAPLSYDLGPYDFFRIEGHLGRPVQTAIRELNALRTHHGVPFDLVAVRLSTVHSSVVHFDDFSCQFEDLNTILTAFRTEMNCLLAEGAAFFSGFTASADKPHISLTLLDDSSRVQKWIIGDQVLQPFTVRGIAAATASPQTVSVDTNNRPDNPVLHNKHAVHAHMDSHPNTFGQYFSQAFGPTVDSVEAVQERGRTIAITANALEGLSNDEQHVVFEYPLQIVAHLNHLQTFIPSSLAEIDTRLLADYRKFNQSFCARLQVIRIRLEGYFKTNNYTARGFEFSYLNMLNTLKRLCCGHERLDVILAEINRRKQAILAQFTFAHYAEQHPGLEHQAGVPRGGTFVMVYADHNEANSTIKQKNVVIADFCLPYRCCANGCRANGPSRELHTILELSRS